MSVVPSKELPEDLEKTVTVPIYKDDSYYTIAERFIKLYGDDDLADGYFLVCNEIKKNNQLSQEVE